jgi:hypothetical protein
MTKITDQDVLSATSNGDGTHDGVKLAQWLYEAYTGKPLPRDRAEELVQEGVRRARIRRDQEARSDV